MVLPHAQDKKKERKEERKVDKERIKERKKKDINTYIFIICMFCFLSRGFCLRKLLDISSFLCYNISMKTKNVLFKNQIPCIEDLRMSNLSKKDGHWPWEKKYEVVTQLLASGNQRLVSALTKVPYETISAWKKTEWWEELALQVKHQQTLKVDNKLSQIIDKSLDVVMDRLENGEVVLNKSGTLVRKPVVLRDASKAANDLLARQHIIRKTLDDTPEKTETMQDTLKKLASEFAKFTRKVDKASATTIEYTEVEDAIHEEREA